MSQTKTGMKEAASTELEHVATAPDQDYSRIDVEKTETLALESDYRTSMKTYVVLILMGITWGTCTLANVGPSSTYSHAVTELGGATIESWIPNAGLFPLIGLQPFWGTCADRFGKKWFIVAGGAFGIVGNVVAGSATSLGVIIGGQVLNGIGSSLFLLVIPAGMEIVSAKNRSFAQGIMGLINGIMAIVGLLEAGAFAKMSIGGWRWVYYFNAIFFGFSALSILVFYRPPPTKLRRELTTATEIRSLDFLGIPLLLLGVIGVVIALTWGGNAYPWGSARVIAFLVVGIAFLAAFGFYEAYGRTDGLIDHRFLQSRNFLLVLSVAFVDGMLLYGVNAFLPVEASAIFTPDPVKVNVYLLPLNICVLVGIVAASYILGVFKHYRILLTTSVLIISLFCGLLALVTPSRVAMMLVFTGIIGLGVGVTTVLPVVILTYAVPSHLLGTAGTVLASVRALGGTVGITVFASIYGNAMKANLPGGVAQAAIKAGLPASSAMQFVGAFLGGDPSALLKVAGVTPTIIAAAASAVKTISAHSFRNVWIANAAIGGATFLLTLFLRPVGDKMTVHVESPLEDGKLREHIMHQDIEG